MIDLEERIYELPAENIQDILDAVVDRWKMLFPERDIITISIAKGNDRNAQLDAMISLLQKLKLQA